MFSSFPCAELRRYIGIVTDCVKCPAIGNIGMTVLCYNIHMIATERDEHGARELVSIRRVKSFLHLGISATVYWLFHT